MKYLTPKINKTPLTSIFNFVLSFLSVSYNPVAKKRNYLRSRLLIVLVQHAWHPRFKTKHGTKHKGFSWVEMFKAICLYETSSSSCGTDDQTRPLSMMGKHRVTDVCLQSEKTLWQSLHTIHQCLILSYSTMEGSS